MATTVLDLEAALEGWGCKLSHSLHLPGGHRHRECPTG